MDIAFIMGMIAGFLLGIGFCLFFTNMVANRMIKILSKGKGDDENNLLDDDPVNYWKPKGWRPDKYEES